MKIPTLTIVTAARNEELGIRKTLSDLASQYSKGFKIDKVYVLCDGCTDNTESVAKLFKKKIPQLEVLNDHKQLGKLGRMRQGYQLSKSDYIITMDSDISIPDRFTLQKFINELKSPSVGLVSAQSIPHKSNTLVGEAVNAYEKFWRDTVRDIKNGNSVFRHSGCMVGLKKTVYKKLKNGPDVTAEDHFIYFSTLQFGFEYRCVKNTSVFFTAPQNLADYLKQATRFQTTRTPIEKLFSKTALREYDIPFSRKARAYIANLVSDPIHMSLAIILQIILRIRLLIPSSYTSSGAWAKVISTQ